MDEGVDQKRGNPLLDMKIAIKRSIFQPFAGLELPHVLVVELVPVYIVIGIEIGVNFIHLTGIRIIYPVPVKD